MAIALQQPDHEVFVPHRAGSLASFLPRASMIETFRWACFLDQGGNETVSRERAIEALAEMADDDPDVLYAAKLYALRALRQGVATRGTVELLQRALDLTTAAAI